MRNEDYDRELLAAVVLICAAIAAIDSAFTISTRPVNVAVAKASTIPIENPATVRIVGTPFVPNTNPSVR